MAADANAPVDTLAPQKLTSIRTVEQLQAQKKQIEESDQVEETLKAKILEAYDLTITRLKLVSDLGLEKKRYDDFRQNAPVALDRIKQVLSDTKEGTHPSAEPNMPLSKREQALTEATLVFEAAREKAVLLEKQPKKWAERRTQIPEQINTAKEELLQVDQQLSAETDAADASDLAQITRIALDLRKKELEQRIEVYSSELLYYDAAGDLLAAQRDLATRNQEIATAMVDFWQETVHQARRDEAQKATQQAKKEAKQTEYAHPLIQALAEENALLAEEQAGVTTKVQETQELAQWIDTELGNLTQDLMDLKAKVEKAGGVTSVMGVLLLAKRGDLPGTSANTGRIEKRLVQISQAQLKWIEYDRQWSDLGHVEDQLTQRMAQADVVVTENQKTALQAKAVALLQTQRDTVKTLADLHLDYSSLLANVDSKERAFVKTVQAYTDFIDENILWVKSAPALNISDLGSVLPALQWLVRPVNWKEAGQALYGDVRSHPLAHGLIAVLFVLLLGVRKRHYHRIAMLTEKTRHPYTDRFAYTLRVLSSPCLYQ